MKVYTIMIAMFISLSSMAQTNWIMDKSHTDIRFAATHMKLSEVNGEFNDFEIKVVSNEENFHGSDVEFSAKIASIDTDNEKRDNHLKSADFFDAENFPELKFEGNIVKEGENYYLAGDLKIRDVSKSVRFPVKYNGQVQGMSGKIAGFKITGSIDRFDYGLKWGMVMEAGGLVVGREISITCNVELMESTDSE